MEGRRAEPCEAQRADRAPGKDWLRNIAAVHSITSYPVGSVSEPIFRMHAARKPIKDETHLRNGIDWPLGGTVIIHPHMGICESRPLIDTGQFLARRRAARGAMRSAARRPDPG